MRDNEDSWKKSLWNGQGEGMEERIMSNLLEFADRGEFRKWLCENCLSNADVWLLFGKAGGPKTLKAGEALEEAICFGWIDGQA